MRNVRIIGDDIYYKDVLVAKLVNSPMRTIQGEFVDKFDDPDQESYENFDVNLYEDNNGKLMIYINERINA